MAKDKEKILEDEWYVIFVVIILVVVYFVISPMCEDDSQSQKYTETYSSSNKNTYQSSSSSNYDSNNYASQSYSWIYGTWVATQDGDKHVVSLGENGMYVESFQSSYYGSQTSDVGSFTISNGKIRLVDGDGYTSYMEIDTSRKVLKSGGISYRKRY